MCMSRPTQNMFFTTKCRLYWELINILTWLYLTWLSFFYLCTFPANSRMGAVCPSHSLSIIGGITLYSGCWCVPMWEGAFWLGDDNTQLLGGGWSVWCILLVNHWHFYHLPVHSALIECWGYPFADPGAPFPVTPPYDRHSQSVIVSYVNHF